MSLALVLSYYELNDPSTGGPRRVHALLRTLGHHAVLIQPCVHHPECITVPYPMDFGRRKVGINWGIFNYRWPPTRRIVRGVVRSQCPSVVVLTSIWTEPPLRRLSRVPKVLDAHNVDAVAIRERFGPGHPFTRLVRAQEARTVAMADHVFACSDEDRAMFLREYELAEDKVTVVPNGVDLDAYDLRAGFSDPDAFWRTHLDRSTVLFFMGKLDYQPNRAALDFLSRVVMPHLDRRYPGRFKLLVCGGPIPSGEFHPGIVFAGRVSSEKLIEYMTMSDICLAPVFTGSGTRLKVIEYLAAGRPVVSTQKGAEGLGCVPGRDLLVAENDDFAEAIVSIHESPERCAALGRAGRDFVRAHFDWTRSIQPRWRAVLGRWIQALDE